ncbi:hypothetical protein HY772_05165 [Candidatus Woesearchaeota archaeon]|nr:hypothetical protein [Candidatus Woesearchaeota archaeon]
MAEDKWLLFTGINILYSGILGGLVGFFGSQALLTRSNYIPKTEQVQQGFVIPSKLEVKLQDLNNDGKDEVLMKYDGKSYLLKLDEQGRPQVQAYEVKPAEVVPRE